MLSGSPRRILVTGVDGMAGCNLADWFSRRAQVTGLYRDHPVMLPGCDTQRWDDASHPGLWSLIDGLRPDWIVHCGPLARGSWDLFADFDKPGNEPPHVDGEQEVCRALAEASQRAGARLTILSTDAVLAGPRMFHDEQSPAVSRHPLAWRATAIERMTARVGALVVRTHAYGWSPRGDDASFVERVWLALTEGATCVLDPHAHATPILAADLARILWLAYRRGLHGLYHIAGAERVNPVRFAGELASLAGLPLSRRQVETDLPAASAAGIDRETSLNSGRARRDLGCALPMLREGLIGLLAQLDDGTRERLRGCMRAAARAA